MVLLDQRGGRAESGFQLDDGDPRDARRVDERRCGVGFGAGGAATTGGAGAGAASGAGAGAASGAGAGAGAASGAGAGAGAGVGAALGATVDGAAGPGRSCVG